VWQPIFTDSETSKNAVLLFLIMGFVVGTHWVHNFVLESAKILAYSIFFRYLGLEPFLNAVNSASGL
jgi:hypothetical protein